MIQNKIYVTFIYVQNESKLITCLKIQRASLYPFFLILKKNCTYIPKDLDPINSILKKSHLPGQVQMTILIL
jgi:hypothetical protein